MQIMNGIRKLRTFVKRLVSDRVNSRERFRDWKKLAENEEFMASCFDYKREGDMPKITALVDLDFHPNLPLILLNYSKTAHNTLHRFGDKGWTEPLRLCRGTVFCRRGTLVGLAFRKFFNYGEHPETLALPDEAFEATTKHDGHLGIIFWYKGQLVITTRGVFASRSSKLGAEMLQRAAEQGDWRNTMPKHVTVLVEMIHPNTKVHVDYQGREAFILIGAYNCRNGHDYDHKELSSLASALKISVAERWTGSTVAELRKLMADLSVKNREGFVVRFASGLRVKFKFAAYINEMVKDKLKQAPYRYLMMRMMTGTLDKMTGNLEGEVFIETARMVEELKAAPQQGTTRRKQLAYLRSIVPEEQCTPYYRTVAGKFLTYLTTGKTDQSEGEEDGE